MPNTPAPKVGRSRYAKAIQFFRENAGFSYDPKTETPAQGKLRCARLSAKAEAWAKAEGLEYVWEFDDMADASFVDTWEPAEQAQWHAETHEAWYCSLVRPCPKHGVQCKHAETLASLGGIFDPTWQYRRVIEAELATEAMG